MWNWVHLSSSKFSIKKILLITTNCNERMKMIHHQKSLFFICFIILCELYQINAYGVDDNEIGDFEEPVLSEFFVNFWFFIRIKIFFLRYWRCTNLRKRAIVRDDWWHLCRKKELLPRWIEQHKRVVSEKSIFGCGMLLFRETPKKGAKMRGWL